MVVSVDIFEYKHLLEARKVLSTLIQQIEILFIYLSVFVGTFYLSTKQNFLYFCDYKKSNYFKLQT